MARRLAAVAGLALLALSDASLEIKKGSLVKREGQTEYSFEDEVQTGDHVFATFGYAHSEMDIGWNQLNITTMAGKSDMEQGEAAGYIEGYQTAASISIFVPTWWPLWGWKNATYLPKSLKDFHASNEVYIEKMVAAHAATDPYWHQAGVVWSQFKGMVKGYMQAQKENPTELMLLSEFELWTCTTSPDFLQLIPALKGRHPEEYEETIVHKWNPNKPGKRHSVEESHCSGLIKFKDDMSDVFFGQATWLFIDRMVRLVKHYHWNFNGGKAPFSEHFTSFPATLPSSDDFYITSNKLAVMETSLNLYNSTLNQYIQPDLVLYWMRVLVANRMATDGESWSQTFKRFNSGTYCNQWMIFDQKKFTPGQQLPPGSLTVLEQMPGPYVEYGDVTNVLNFGYWPSYNLPYWPMIWQVSGNAAIEKQCGVQCSYSGAPRAQMFRRGANDIETLEDAMKFMRYNNYKTDPLSHGNPNNGIANRADLDTARPACFSAIDAKVSSAKMMNDSRLPFFAQAGPTHEFTPVFEFNTTKADCWFSKHPGLIPNRWDFPYYGFY